MSSASMSTACGRRWNTTGDAPVTWRLGRRFERAKDSRLVVRLQPEEVDLLRHLAGDRIPDIEQVPGAQQRGQLTEPRRHRRFSKHALKF